MKFLLIIISVIFIQACNENQENKETNQPCESKIATFESDLKDTSKSYICKYISSKWTCSQLRNAEAKDF